MYGSCLAGVLAFAVRLIPRNQASGHAGRTAPEAPSELTPKCWPALFVWVAATISPALYLGPAISPAFAEGKITIGGEVYEYGDFETQQDGTSKADIFSSPEGDTGTLIRNPDGTKLISLAKGKKILIAGDDCTDNPDIVKDYKEVTVRECRRDEDGKLAWYKVTYLEYVCTKPPYYTRRIPQSVIEEEPEAPCTEEDYQASGRNAAIYGAKWVGIKPPTETPPPGKTGGIIDTPPGVTKYPCLTDEAKADLRRAQQNLALEFVKLTEVLKKLHPVNLAVSSAQDGYKAVKAKVEAAAKAGDVQATNDANRELWHAGNRLEAAKKQLAGLIEVIKLHQRWIEYYKRQIDYYSSLPPCPEVKEVQGGGGGGKPTEKPGSKPLKRWTPLFPESWKISTGTDGESWCTYGDGNNTETAISLTDDSGAPVVALLETLDAEIEKIATLLESTPQGPMTPPETPEAPSETGNGSPPAPDISSEPAITPETQEPVESTPGETPTIPEKPDRAEKEPEQPPTPPEERETAEKPPEETAIPEQKPEEPIPDTIFVKAKESVLRGEEKGEPIENQVVKLFPTEEPDLPGTGTKEAQDTGFDKDPVQCTTGADGECKAQVPPEDRAAYGLPDTGALPAHYRADYELPKDSGGVAETIGKPAEPDVKTGTPAGAEVKYEEFKIGNRTFVRLVYVLPHDVEHDFEEQFKPVLGESYEEDYCRDKQPGPPLGMQPSSFSALNHDLPEASVRFHATVSAPGAAR
jgi:hypothetical protein